MYQNKRLVILDADGTTIDAFSAIALTFEMHDMDIGDLNRFQSRHNLFKYLGGVKEFPKNLKKQLSRVKRSRLIKTLTEVYREQAELYAGFQLVIQQLQDAPDVTVGVVTRNITNDPLKTLEHLFRREQVDVDRLDFLIHIPLKQKKTETFKQLRQKYEVNPALACVCGDEHKDYAAAIASGMHPFIVSYGFENHERLTEKFDIPNEVISDSPAHMSQRLLHFLSLQNNE